MSAENGDVRVRRHRPAEPVGDAWRKLVELLDGRSWSRVQYNEMRAAFFAGAWATFGLVCAASTAADLDVVHEELKRYRASLDSDGKD